MKFYMESLCRPRGRMAKILLVMKLIVLLLTTAILQVSASTYGQNVTLKQTNVPLAKVLDEIRKQTGYDFFYSEKVMDRAKPVSINLNNVGLLNALEICFRDQPLSYSIENNTVTIKAKEKTILENVIVKFQAIDVFGRVVGQDGQPLIGATISVKNGRMTTTTDKDGKFSLKKLNDDAVLVISYIGYLNKEVNANADLSGIVLEISNSKLDEVQVIAYGTTSQRLSTGNVSSVKAEDIEKSPVVNPLLSLQGRVPGLFVSQSSGLSGAGVNPMIQGKNSILFGTDPLIVVDGISYPSELLPGLSGILGQSGNNINGGQGSPLNYINPQDIESISILKDADATSIYGSRAANGVILITTKKGKAGRTKVDVNLKGGIGQLARKMKLLNTSQYLAMRQEAIANDGIDLNSSPYNEDFFKYLFFGDLNIWDQKRYTDWQKVLLGGTAQYTDFQGTISGGNNNTQFLVGGNYHRETTVFPRDKSDRKGSIHFNINNVSDNQKFRFSLSGNYQADNNNLSNTDFTNLALSLPPNAPTLYNSDGTLNWEPAPNGASTWNNPVASLLNTYAINTNNLVASSNISYEILPGLVLKSVFGYTNLQSNELGTSPNASKAPEIRATSLRFASVGNNNINSWSIEPQLNYAVNTARGKIDVLLGSSFQQKASSGFSQNSYGYSSDALLENVGAATNFLPPSVLSTVYRYNAIFGRINYNLEDKYIINISARRDGSSRFGSANQLHNFGSAGAAWVFSNEVFMKKIAPVLSFGKIRISYGTTGNDQIGDYQFLSLYSPLNPAIPYQNTPGLIVNNLSNPYLQWENTTKAQAGVELGFFKDRLFINAGYYRNRSSNQLLGYSLPMITGFASITENFPATVQNYGWEITINSTNVDLGNFKWTSSLNVTIPKNKLIAFPNLSTSSYANSLIIGQPITIIKTYHFLGVNPATGLYQFAGADGIATSDPGYGPENQNSIINTAPVFYGGLQNSINYKRLSLDFIFQFVKQKKQSFYYGNQPGQQQNAPATILNAWQTTGENNKIQRYGTGLSNAPGDALYFLYGSDGSYADASYIRLKNLSLSWALPDQLSNYLKIQTCKVYVQAQNLFTVTKYPGLDPEVSGTFSLPPLRVITLGIQASL